MQIGELSTKELLGMVTDDSISQRPTSDLLRDMGVTSLRNAPPPSLFERVSGGIKDLFTSRDTMSPSDIAEAQIRLEAKEKGIPKEEYITQANPAGEGIRKVERFGRGVERGAIGTVEGMAGFAEWLSNGAVGKDLANQARLWQRDLTPDEVFFSDELASGVGSMATFFIPGMGVAKGAGAIAKISPKLASWFGAATGAGMEAATEAGQVYRDVVNETKDVSKAESAATKTFWMNVPVVLVTNKIGVFGETGGALRRGLVSAPVEGLQEGSQEIISTKAQGKPIDWKNVETSTLVGAITGGGFGAVGGAFNKTEGKDKGLKQDETSVKDILADGEKYKREYIKKSNEQREAQASNEQRAMSNDPSASSGQELPGKVVAYATDGKPIVDIKTAGSQQSAVSSQEAKTPDKNIQGQAKEWERGTTIGEELKAKQPEVYEKLKEVGSQESETLRQAQDDKVKEKDKLIQEIYDRINEGSDSAVSTERGTKVNTNFAVVDANDITTSHDTSLNINPDYPAELQPRERERMASQIQVDNIINNLKPEFLGESPKASEGSPIIGKDLVVESGNGRVIALKKGYEGGHKNIGVYRQWLSDNADRFGISREDIDGIAEPVLVRIRQSDVDRGKFVREANEQTIASMSASEQAKADAGHLTPDMFSLFEPSDTGEINTAQNRRFVRGFFSNAIPVSEMGRYLDSQGNLSQEGVRRVSNAIFAKAYGDAAVIEKFSESTDNNVKGIANVMTTVGPKFAMMQDGISKGDLHDFNISNDIAQAVKKLSHLRDTGQSFSNYLGQGALFDDGVTPLAKDVLGVFDYYKRSPKKLKEIFDNYVEAVNLLGSPKQMALLQGQEMPTRAEILQASIRKMEVSGNVQASLFKGENAAGYEGVSAAETGKESEFRGREAETKNRESELDVSLSLGKGRVSVENIAEIVAEIERIAAPGTQVDVQKKIEVKPEHLAGLKRWGYKDLSADIEIAGTHQRVSFDGERFTSLIELSLDYMNPTTPYHEAFHSVQELLLSDEEIRRLEERFPAKDGISSKERQAEAFARYAQGRRNYPVWVREIFERIKEFLEKLRSFAKGKGWTSANVRDIFENAYSGKMRERGLRGGKDEGVELDVARLEGRIFSDDVWKARKEAMAWARENLQGKSFKNDDTGWDIRVSKLGLTKAISGDRVFPLEHIETVRAIPELLQKAKLMESYPDRKGDTTIKQIHRFYAPLEIDNKLFNVKLTVKEFDDGQVFYDHSLTEMERATGTARRLPQGRDVSGSTARPLNKNIQPSSDDVKGEIDLDIGQAKNTREMFAKGEKQRLEQIDRKRPLNIIDDFKKAIIDKNTGLIKRYERMRRQGKVIAAEDNPLYWIEELPYISGEVYNYLNAFDNTVKTPAEKEGITIDDIGDYMFFRRIATERVEIANPLGHNKESAERQLTDLKKRLGDERYGKLEGYVKEYWKLRQEHIIPLLEKAGMYSDVLMEKIKNNENYATFDIIKSLEGRYGRGVTGNIYKQVGTLHEVRNPAIATVMKDAALIRAANVNMAKEKIVSFLNDNFSDEIQKADTRWNGKYQEPVLEPPKPDEQGTITLLKNGKVEAYYAPREIADNFNREPYEANIILRGWQELNRPLRAILVSKNPLWMPGNVIRDVKAVYKQLPGMTAAKMVKYYSKALGDAFNDVFRGKESETVSKMLKGKMLVMDRHFGTIDMPAETELDRMLQSYGQSPVRYRNMVVRPIMKVLDFLGDLGKFTERVPKIAGYKYLTETKPEISEKEVAHIVRTRAGTPDPYRRGAWHTFLNSIFMFSNIGKEGYRASWEAYQEDKADYMWKTFKVNIMPKLALAAVAAGALGDELKEIIRGISDYDKENYTIIPLGKTEKGKSVYLRIPQDFTGQVVGGVVWNLLSGEIAGKGGLFAYGAEQQPYGLNPFLTVGKDWLQYLSGRNPYNVFYGRYVIPEREFKAGGWRSHKEMIGNTANELGGTVIHRFKGEGVEAVKSELEKALEYPPGNILGKFLKVSDKGIRDELRKVVERVGSKEAGRQLEVRDRIIDVVNKATDEGRKPIASDMVKLYHALVKEKLIDSRNTSVMQFRGMFNRYASRSEGSPYIDAVINAGSNKEKAALLREFKNILSDRQYDEIVRNLIIEEHLTEGALTKEMLMTDEE